MLQAFKKLIKREERRQYPRKPLSELIGFGIDDCVFNGFVNNISMGGMFIQTDTKRIVRRVYAGRASRNDEPVIKFIYSSAGDPQIKATGHIVRMNRHGIGVVFVSVKEGMRYLSGQYLCTSTETVNNHCEKELIASTLSEERPGSSKRVVSASDNTDMVETENGQFLGASWPDSGDEILKAAIIGTWVSRYPQLGGGETTYFVNGHATASVYADSPELIPPEAHIRGSWKISGGRLITRVLETNPPGILPIGHTSTCWIESVNVEELVLITEDKTHLVERRRGAKNRHGDILKNWESKS